MCAIKQIPKGLVNLDKRISRQNVENETEFF
jgi:hypothetical protein